MSVCKKIQPVLGFFNKLAGKYIHIQRAKRIMWKSKNINYFYLMHCQVFGNKTNEYNTSDLKS